MTKVLRTNRQGCRDEPRGQPAHDSKRTTSTSGSSTRCVYDSDPELGLRRGRARSTPGLKALKRARSRYLGFTGHKDPSISTLDMLGRPFEWATVQMPLNVMDVHFRGFQKRVSPELARRASACSR